MELAWKQNWEETKQNLTRWWNREGLAIGMWGATVASRPHEDVSPPGIRHPKTSAAYYTDTPTRAQANHFDLCTLSYPADMFPVANTDMGPGCLALFLGSEPEFREDTVWMHPCHDAERPEDLPTIRLDPENRWWKIHQETIEETLALGRGKYLVGLPDLYGGMDTLGLMRGIENFMMDLIERPEWVLEKTAEVDQALFDVAEEIFAMIRLEDGSTADQNFRLWAPGATMHLQCDLSAMISPAMFEQFAVPFLKRQARWFDYTMFHLDGQACLKHLDMILDIEEIDAIEWTPDPKGPDGGSPEWYDLYRKILDAGKAVQPINVWAHEVVPLLDAIGGEGVYVLGLFANEAEVEQVLKDVEGFR
ncbi:MAG: hypothetical protein ACWGSD_03165 [Thermodesulfobacteriota bacterium]